MDKLPKHENFLERLKQLVDRHTDGKHTVFAKYIGIPISTFQNIVNGQMPKAEHLLLIAEKCDVSIDWLLRGEGGYDNQIPSIDEKVEDDQKRENNAGCAANVIELQHMELIKGFQDKKIAKKINEILIEIEHLRPLALKDIENYLTGVANGLKMAVGQDHYIGEERRSSDRRKNDVTGTGPGGKDRRDGTDRRKTGT